MNQATYYVVSPPKTQYEEEPIVFRVIDLAFQFADLIKNHPERARTVAKILVGIGVAVGVVTYFYTR